MKNFIAHTDKTRKEMLNSIKEFNEKILDFSNTIKLLQARKDWIDKIIEKINKKIVAACKILPFIKKSTFRNNYLTKLLKIVV